MAITTPRRGAAADRSDTAEAAPTDWSDPRYQAFALTRVAFTAAPIAFGLDKFLNEMVQWPVYLAHGSTTSSPGTAQELMYVVGAIEILAASSSRSSRATAANRRGVARRHHREPAHVPGLLRHRATRLRAHARSPHARAPRGRVRPAIGPRRGLSGANPCGQASAAPSPTCAANSPVRRPRRCRRSSRVHVETSTSSRYSA